MVGMFDVRLLEAVACAGVALYLVFHDVNEELGMRN